VSSGYFKIWRKALDHALWEPSRERTRFEAWVFLICKAKGGPGEEHVGYSNIPLERGQLIFSIKCLAKNWKWSRGRVRRFLEYLVKEEMIEVNRGCIGGDSKPYTQTDTPYSILTICNYDLYNPLKKETDTQTDTQRTPSGHLADTKNEVNEVNEVNEIINDDELIFKIQDFFDLVAHRLGVTDHEGNPYPRGFSKDDTGALFKAWGDYGPFPRQVVEQALDSTLKQQEKKGESLPIIYHLKAVANLQAQDGHKYPLYPENREGMALADELADKILGGDGRG